MSETARRVLAFRIALKAGLAQDDAQDCAQEFVLRHLDVRRDMPMAWWGCCARNHARDFARSHQRQRARRAALDESVAVDPDGGVSEIFRDAERQALSDAMSRLAPDVRVLVFRHYFEGVSVAELARSLNISEGATQQRLHRARQALAKRLGAFR